jgi:hypothetical protein
LKDADTIEGQRSEEHSPSGGGLGPFNRILRASLCAIAVQPFLALLYFGPFFVLPALLAGEPMSLLALVPTLLAVTAIAAAHLIILGLPLFWALKRWGRLNFLSVALAGFLVGSGPVTAFYWPTRNSAGSSYSYTSGGKIVWTEIDGVPTLAAWLDTLKGAAFYGGFGAVGALVFWVIWQRYGGHTNLR